MFDFILVELAVALILITTIARSIFAKQKHNLLYSAILVASCFITFFAMMYSESFLLDFADALKINELYAKFGGAFNKIGMENFYALFVMIIFAMMIFAILVLVTLPIVISINKKERNQDYYLASNSIGANVILGVVRAIIYCVIYLAIISTITDALQIEISSKLLDVFNDSISMKVINDFSKENLTNLFKEVL